MHVTETVCEAADAGGLSVLLGAESPGAHEGTATVIDSAGIRSIGLLRKVAIVHHGVLEDAVPLINVIGRVLIGGSQVAEVKLQPALIGGVPRQVTVLVLMSTGPELVVLLDRQRLVVEVRRCLGLVLRVREPVRLGDDALLLLDSLSRAHDPLDQGKVFAQIVDRLDARVELDPERKRIVRISRRKR